MSKDVKSDDGVDLSVIFESDEDDGRVYHFYKYGESVEDTEMKIKLRLAEYRQILDCLYQHGAEHRSMRRRLSKITQRNNTVHSKNKCLVCNIPINLENVSDFVTCGSCNQSPICRNSHCAILNEQSKTYDCKLCRSFLNGSNSACDWLISQLNEKLLQGKGVDGQNKIVWDKSNSNDKTPLIPLEQREKVREFVEELVSTLVGGSIDNAPVGQLSESKECLPTGENETDSIDQSHTNLRRLVERIIEEVFKIPEFFDHSGVPSQPQRIDLPQFDPKKYEELLATAVLNKLVESYSYERRFENSSGVHSGSDLESNVQTVLPKAQVETNSTSSSNEPRSDSSNSVSLNDQPMSLTATDYIDNLSREHSNSSPIDSPPQSPRSVGSDEEAYLSDYIQKHKVPLPGIAHDSDSFDEEFQSVDSNDTEGNWQENWLFKKRKLKNETAAAIGMLVPSPMEDVKALIGDKTTDEVSDLSEAGSDLDDDENGPLNGRRSADLPHVLTENKTIIGGKNEISSFDEVKTIDELLQPDSLVSMQSIDNQSPIIMEAKNDLILMSESNTKPVVLEVKEKRNQTGNGKISSDFIAKEVVSLQKASSQSATSQLTEPIIKDIQNSKGTIFDMDSGEPPVPTPRRKSKSSAEQTKQVAAVEVLPQPTIQENNNIPTDNDTIVSQIFNDFDVNKEVDELIALKAQSKLHSLDDDLLDSSINDIYESIEGDSAIDYQSLVAETEKVTNEIDLFLKNKQLTLNASNEFIEDCLNETTQEISQEQLTKSHFVKEPEVNVSNENYICKVAPTELDLNLAKIQFDTQVSVTEPQVNVSNENYICKVAPTEFDLSVDDVFQSKAALVDILPRGIEDKTVPQGVYISTKPALVAVEIAHHATDTQTQNGNLEQTEKIEPTTSIPTLIISKSAADTPPPIVPTDDVLLKPKKVLKAQDSLELPKDDRDMFEPAKRVNSFDSDDVERNIDSKFRALENIVNSVAEYVKSSPENQQESTNVANDVEKESEPDESFVIVSDEEVIALKIEEQESLSNAQTHVAVHSEPQSDDSLVKKSENLLLDLAHVNDKNLTELSADTHSKPNDIQKDLPRKRLSKNQSIEIDEIENANKSQNYTSVIELSPQPQSNASAVISTQKTIELSSPIKNSASLLPAIQELTTHLDTLEHTKSSGTNSSSKKFTTNQTITLDSNIMQLRDHGPLPGSIAEREHLKWKNAQDIPNNPYSAEALQRRLSQTKSPTKIIDINLALAAKPIDDLSLQPEAGDGKPIQIVLGAGEPDHLRYGRDYYINDAKTARGTRKKASSLQRYSSTDEDNISSKPTTPDSDVFTAKIVQIKEDQGHISDDSSKLKLSISDTSSLSLHSDSLTLSDDSETRVYDLRKNETAYLRNDIIRTSRIPIGTTVTPPPTPVDGGESAHKNLDQFFAVKQLNQLKKSKEDEETTSQTKSPPAHIGRIQNPAKPLSPETLKFFAPKPKPVFTSKIKMEEVVSIKPLVLERENKDIPLNIATEKVVIEEDVISSLPSVKALAKNFLETSTENTPPPIQRPKSFTWQVSKENGNSTNGFVKEPSADSFIPLYESRYHPVAPGHSITARSLSTKFREELRHSISDDNSNGTDNIEIVEREHSPDRPSSPVLLKGIFKEKMSFFQNLETK